MSGSPWVLQAEDIARMQVFRAKNEALEMEVFTDPYLPYDFTGRALSRQPGQDPVVKETEFARRKRQGLLRKRLLPALAILLIELCLGKALPQSWQEDQQSQNSGGSGSPIDVPDELEMANELLDRVEINVDPDCHEGIKKCLRNGFSGKDSNNWFDFGDFRQKFFDEVITPFETRLKSYA